MEIGGGVKNARVCNHHLVKKMTDLASAWRAVNFEWSTRGFWDQIPSALIFRQVWSG